MKLINSSTEYGLISKSFHWLSAAVLIIQIPLGMYLVDMDFSEKRLTIENIHVAVGISIFYLTILRLIYKTFNLEIQDNFELAEIFYEIHILGNYTLIALISLHIFAVLIHKILFKENLLKRIL